MSTRYEIQLTPEPQTFSIALAGAFYQVDVEWHNFLAGGWFMTIARDERMLAASIPLVTGVNLLAQFRHLGIGGGLYVVSDGEALREPTLDNLGQGSHLYFVAT